MLVGLYQIKGKISVSKGHPPQPLLIAPFSSVIVGVLTRKLIFKGVDFLKAKWRGWDLRVNTKSWEQSEQESQNQLTFNLLGRLKEKWRGWDLNPEPMAYESTAPPLSYLAERTLILTETEKNVNQNCGKWRPFPSFRSKKARLPLC